MSVTNDSRKTFLPLDTLAPFARTSPARAPLDALGVKLRSSRERWISRRSSGDYGRLTTFFRKDDEPNGRIRIGDALLTDPRQASVSPPDLRRHRSTGTRFRAR